MMADSMVLIVTAGSVMPRTHEPSHGAGQTRPVNSGKLLVLCRRSSASFHNPRNTRSFHSGMRLFTGQPEAAPEISLPVWQNGTPQSMQRAPCWRSRFSSMWWWNSFQSRTRSAGERSTGSSRRYSIKPVGLPIYLVLLLVSADARRVARVLLERRHDGLVARQSLVVRPLEAGEHALVILGDHAQEMRQLHGPGGQDVLGMLAAGGRDVFGNQC